jgi:putative transposase
VRESGVVKAKAVCLATGIDMTGNKEVVGMWIAQNDGAKFWL